MTAGEEAGPSWAAATTIGANAPRSKKKSVYVPGVGKAFGAANRAVKKHVLRQTPKPRGPPGPYVSLEEQRLAQEREARVYKRYQRLYNKLYDKNKVMLSMSAQANLSVNDRLMTVMVQPPDVSGVSLFVLGPDNKFRQFCNKVLFNPFTELLLQLTILVNVIALAMDTTAVREEGGTDKFVINLIDRLCLFIYTMEMVLQIIVRTFMSSQDAYINDGWCRLDGIVVISGWIEFLVPWLLPLKVNALRALRAIRPLRAIQAMKGLRTIADAVMLSIPHLIYIVFALVFVVVLFAIFGIQLFAGTMRFQCVHIASGDPITPLTNCGEGAWAHHCSAELGQECREVGNPNGGLTSFDNAYHTFLLNWQTMTMDSWGDYMYTVMQATSPLAALYFVVMISTFQFLIVNLFIAVISTFFGKVRVLENHGLFGSTKQSSARAWSFSTWLSLKWEKFKNRHNISDRLDNWVMNARDVQFVPQWAASVADAICNNTKFEMSIMLVICLNTVAFLLPYRQMSQGYANVLQIMNYCFVTIFFLEIVIRSIAARGLFRFLSQSSMNRFDFAIVVLTSFSPFIHSSKLMVFNLLRIARLARILRLMVRVKGLADLLRKSFKNLSAILSLFSFIMFILIVFSILGMQLYGGPHQQTNDLGMDRFNFANMFNGFVSWFQVMTGASWTGVMYTYVYSPSQFIITPIVFIAFYCLAQYVLVNIFIVIILENFEEAEDEDEVAALEKEEDPKEIEMKVMSGDGGKYDAMQEGLLQDGVLRQDKGGVLARTRGFFYDQLYSEERQQYSCFFLKEGSFARNILVTIALNKYFDAFIMFVIVMSCVQAAVHTYITASALAWYFELTRYVLLLIFTVEAVLKILALGFYFTPTGYLSNKWNVFDFVIVLAMYAEIVLVMSLPAHTQWLKGFTVSLRALRVVRIGLRIRSMRVILESLLESMEQILYTTLFFMINLMVFSAIAMMLWMGKLDSCTDSELDKGDCFGSFVNDNNVLAPRAWLRPVHNYDNVFWSMITLFQLATLDTWNDLVIPVLDLTGADTAPQEGYSNFNYIFFIVFIFISAFFLLNLFIGVIISAMSKISGRALLNEHQIALLDLRAAINAMLPLRELKVPTRWPATWVFKFALHPWFDSFIFILIVVNAAVMLLDHADASAEWSLAVKIFTQISTVIFVFEMLLKMWALSIRGYFSDPWNCFDCFVVVTSTTSQVMTLVIHKSAQTSFLRVLRTIRLFRLVKRLKTLQMIFQTLASAAPDILNVMVMLSLVWFVYALLGTKIFAGTRYGSTLNNRDNYATFHSALVSLYRISTGDSWTYVMHDAAIQPPACTITPERNDCGSFLAYPYFISYFIVMNFIFVNLALGVVVESFSHWYNTTLKDITHDHLDDFSEAWKKLDPQGTGYIPITKVRQLAESLEPPLGLVSGRPKYMFFMGLTRRVATMCCYNEQHGVAFRPMLELLVLNRMGLESLANDEKEPFLRFAEVAIYDRFASKFQAIWRGHRCRKQLKGGSSKDFAKRLKKFRNATAQVAADDSEDEEFNFDMTSVYKDNVWDQVLDVVKKRRSTLNLQKYDFAAVTASMYEKPIGALSRLSFEMADPPPRNPDAVRSGV